MDKSLIVMALIEPFEGNGDMPFCPKCGKQVPEDMNVCPHCGNPLMVMTACREAPASIVTVGTKNSGLATLRLFFNS